MSEVEKKMEQLSITGHGGAGFADRMRDWNMQIDIKSVVEMAKIHQAPTINIGGNPTSPFNGSFNLRNVHFSRYANDVV